LRDPELSSYVEAIEAHLGRRRGRDHALSPPDFALARRWLEAGIALGDVIEAIDALVAEGREPTSLALCRRRIEARTTRAPLRSAPESESDAGSPPAAGEERVRAISSALAALGPARGGRFPRTRAALASLGERPGAGALAQLEETLAEEAVDALSESERHALEQPLERAAARQSGRVSQVALEAARRRSLAAAALRRLGLAEAPGGSGAG
jgi:hypothetical protein